MSNTPGLILSPDELSSYQSQYGQDKITPITPTKFQRDVLLRREKELGLFGGKFSGKSFCARLFLIKGNSHLPNYDSNGNSILVNQSYIYHNGYRATILRRNQIDLDDFVRKFKVLVAPYGGEWKNGQFTFPFSQAVIAVGHLGDKDAWQKYIGVPSIRFVIEEAALIPEYSVYEQMLTNCRSDYTELEPQIMLTSNFGGPGTHWILERFIEAKDKDGVFIPAGTPIYEEAPHPINPDEVVRTSRIWMFSTYTDNPYSASDPSYIATMATLKDEKLRRAYIYGDWSVFQGQFFSHFRPRGPNLAEGEPPHANHVLHPPYPTLQPWWPRWGSIDVGYAHDTAVYQACLLPNGQHHIYNEFVVSQASYIQIGYELACRSLDALNGSSHSITYWISHDAIRQDKDRKSIMELISIGIAKRIGPNAVHIPDLVIHKLREAAQYDNRELAEETLKSIRSERKAGITLRIAPSHRVIGWQYCREALRWSTIGETVPPYDPELAHLLLLNFPDKYEEYQTLYRYQKPETLPKLQIWDCCPILLSAIPKARHYPLDSPGKDPEDVDRTHYKGMDSLDSWRYLEMGLIETFPEEPYESFLDRSLAQALDHDPSLAFSSKVMLNRTLEAEFKSKELPSTINIPRKALRRQRESFLSRLTRPFTP